MADMVGLLTDLPGIVLEVVHDNQKIANDDVAFKQV
jgi:hypothetical protein